MASGARPGIAHMIGRILVGYGLLGLLATGAALALRSGLPPWWTSPTWLKLSSTNAIGLSSGLGVVSGLSLVVSTRWMLAHTNFARRLHASLRPIAKDLTGQQILMLALFSSLGEELFFRGLLQPHLTWIGTSLLFGFVHQLPGPSRWIWVAWACVAGLIFGAIFEATGSLAGPLIAHAVVNAFNLKLLRDHDLAAA